MKSIFPVLALLVVTQAHAQQWVDDWFSSSTTTGGGSFESQTRGYYSGGAFQGRWRMSNDYVLSASPPRLKAGCGGIDLFGGGFSYLDPEYLVDKFQRILQAAPAMAFDLALQEFCKPCIAAMETLTDITDQLNSIQVNDCRMAQRTVQMVRSGDPSVMMDEQMQALSNFSVTESYRKNYNEVLARTNANSGVVPQDTRPMIDSCPQIFRDVFGGGSVISNVTGLVGLNQYAAVMRGLVGDAIVTFSSGQNAPAIEVLSPCDGNDQLSPDDFMTGTMEQKSPDDRCSSAGLRGVSDIVEERLEGIANRMRAGTALTADDLAFINRSAMPVYATLRDAITSGTTTETIRLLTEPLAQAYAHRILDDLFRATSLVISNASEVSRDASYSTGATHRCDVSFLREAVHEIERMSERVNTYRSMAHSNYQKRLSELVAHLQYSRAEFEKRKKVLNDFTAVGE